MPLTPLLSVAPKDATEDEHAIAKHYRDWWAWILPAIPLVSGYFAEWKWTIVIGFAVLAAAAVYIEQRLYDLCIRLRRTNEMLRVDVASYNASQIEYLKQISERLFYIDDALGAEDASKRKSEREHRQLIQYLEELVKRDEARTDGDETSSGK